MPKYKYGVFKKYALFKHLVLMVKQIFYKLPVAKWDCCYFNFNYHYQIWQKNTHFM